MTVFKRVAAEPIRTLFLAEPDAAIPVLPQGLRTHYGGDLQFPTRTGRPYVVANFVSTLDGAVSFALPGLAGGDPISGGNDGDRFIMGLLRASADAVLVASGTVSAVSPEHLWLPEFIYPAERDSYAYYRSVLKKAAHPLIVIVSGSGNLELDRAVFHATGVRVVIVTTEHGKSMLEFKGVDALPSTELRLQAARGGRIAPHAILKLLEEEFGAGCVLTEGGPTLFGEFVTCGLIDELFLTIAPQIAGRSRQHSRPAFVEGAEFTPGTAPWLKLLSAKKSGDHLYLRYRRSGEVR